MAETRITLKLTLGDLKLTAGLSNQLRSLVESELVPSQKVLKNALVEELDERNRGVDILRFVATRNAKKAEQMGLKADA